jgi:hypothetical protein
MIEHRCKLISEQIPIEWQRCKEQGGIHGSEVSWIRPGRIDDTKTTTSLNEDHRPANAEVKQARLDKR